MNLKLYAINMVGIWLPLFQAGVYVVNHSLTTKKDNTDVKKITTSQVMIVLAVTSIWLILITGASKFFVGLGVYPLGTISYLLGLLILPFGITYPIARLIAAKSRHSVFAAWISMAVVVLAMMTIGDIRGS